MQYYSLQHRILLSSPDTSTIEHHFCLGPPSSFFLELFLCSAPAAYWTPTNLGGLSSGVISFCSFILFHRVLEVRILEWFAIPFSSGPRFVRTVHHDLSVLGGPTWAWLIVSLSKTRLWSMISFISFVTVIFILSVLG